MCKSTTQSCIYTILQFKIHMPMIKIFQMINMNDCICRLMVQKKFFWFIKVSVMLSYYFYNFDKII